MCNYKQLQTDRLGDGKQVPLLRRRGVTYLDYRKDKQINL